MDGIEHSYKSQFNYKPFTIEFTDKTFANLAVEIWTDSIKYIYDFNGTDHHLNDTLLKYKLKVDEVQDLIRQMQSIHCTWVNNLDYYVGDIKHSMIFMAIRPKSINYFARKKYYIITYFPAKQYYDPQGRLLVNRKLRHIRKINADVFHRITDKVAYTLSDRFR